MFGVSKGGNLIKISFVSVLRRVFAIFIFFAHLLAMAAAGDPVAGKRKVDTCNACHNQSGMKSVPNLGGQNPQYFVTAMRAYQEGVRTHATMRDVARIYSDRDLKNIAAYYAEGAAQGDSSTADSPQITQTCAACHGPDGARTTTPDIPKIAGQKKTFIEQVLREYRSGDRKNEIMQPITAALSDDDIATLAAYFSERKGLILK